MKKGQKFVILFGLIVFLIIATSCAPGNKKFEARPAGFWAGLWHGLICPIAFIISLFTKNVDMYEVNNTGGWYNFGFLIGAAICLGGSWGPRCKWKRKKGKREKEWEEIAEKVEKKVRKGIKNWADESEKKDEWDEIGKKIEEKIKRELRDWAEK